MGIELALRVLQRPSSSACWPSQTAVLRSRRRAGLPRALSCPRESTKVVARTPLFAHAANASPRAATMTLLH
jgi:hypothetical protein